MSNCLRCGRALKRPHSIARGLGPICYKKCGGGTFDHDLEADEAEWQRREELLKNGGEIDFGVNWDYPDPGNMMRSHNMRVSVRYRDGAYEAYGHIVKYGEPEAEEIVFARSTDLKTVYWEAIAAGPNYTAMAHYNRKQAYKIAVRKRKTAC